MMRNIYGMMMTRNDIALSGLLDFNYFIRTQSSASLHSGLWVLCAFGTFLPTHIDEARSLAERDKYQFQWWACTLVGAQAYQGRKKGADGEIDGLIYFQDDNTGAKKIVVSVKGGENVSVSMIRDFAHVIDREKAAMGFFVTLAEPTAPMTTEAVSAGFYNQPDLRNYQKIQILTIEGLLGGTMRPDYPDTSLGALTHKKAQVEKKNKGQEGMF